MPGTKIVHKQLGKGNNYREISGKFGVVASTAYEKVNTTDTEENLFRLVGSIFVSGQPSSIKRNRTRNPNRARLRIRARNTERGHLLSRSDLNELDLRFSSYRARYMSHSAANANTGSI